MTPRSALLVSSLLLGAAICAQAQTAPAVRSDVHHVQFTKADPGSRGDGWAVVRQVLDLPPRHAGRSHRPEVTARGTHRDRRSADIRRKFAWPDRISPTGDPYVNEHLLPALWQLSSRRPSCQQVRDPPKRARERFTLPRMARSSSAAPWTGVKT